MGQRNPAPPKGLDGWKPNKIMGCLPSINWWFGFRNHPQYLVGMLNWDVFEMYLGPVTHLALGHLHVVWAWCQQKPCPGFAIAQSSNIFRKIKFEGAKLGFLQTIENLTNTKCRFYAHNADAVKVGINQHNSRRVYFSPAQASHLKRNMTLVVVASLTNWGFIQKFRVAFSKKHGGFQHNSNRQTRNSSHVKPGFPNPKCWSIRGVAPRNFLIICECNGTFQLPSGKRLPNYGKSPFSVGKSTINRHFQ